jgi:hypothetical protein
MGQGVGPEFKPQYQKKKKKVNYKIIFWDYNSLKVSIKLHLLET